LDIHVFNEFEEEARFLSPEEIKQVTKQTVVKEMSVVRPVAKSKDELVAQFMNDCRD
jgi:hypothetical protein